MFFSKQGSKVYPIIFPTKSSLRSFNFYLIEEKGSLTMIDAGINSEECWNFFLQFLDQNGFSLQDINCIILTHNHEDHVGLVNRMTSIREIPVYAHRESVYRLYRDKDYFSLRMEFFQQLYEEMGCGELGELQVQKLKNAVRKNEKNKIHAKIDILSENDSLIGLQVIETPGHAPDHLVFFDKEKKWLFGGDHVISHISSNAIVEPDKNGKRILALVEYEKSLKKCIPFDVETVFPGHGDLIRNHKELISKRLDRIQGKSERIRAMVGNGMTIPSQIAQSFYKGKYQSEFSLVMSEIIGHLDRLEIQNKVRKEMMNSVWHYHIT